MKKIMLMLGLVVCGICYAHEVTSTNSELKVVQLVKSTNSWDGTVLPAYDRGQPEITMLKITIPPKAKLPIHKHPCINAGVLTKGELTVTTDDGKILQMHPGDPIIEVVHKWHYGENRGSNPAEIIVFYAGTVDSPLTIKKQSK